MSDMRTTTWWVPSAVLAFALITTPVCVLAQVSMGSGGQGTGSMGLGGGLNVSGHSTQDPGVVLDTGDNSAIKPHVGVWVAWDDNVYGSPKGSEQDDWSITVAPGVLWLYGNPDKNYVSVDYTYEWVRYLDLTDADYEAHVLGADLNLEFAKTDIHIADGYTDTVVDDRASAGRVDKVQNILSADIERQVSSKTSFSINGSWEIHDYKNDLAYVDYDEYRLGGRFYYRIRPKTDVFADVTRGIVDVDSTNRVGDATYWETSAGLRGELGRKTEIFGSVGYQQRTFEVDSLATIETWVARLRAAYKVTARLTVGLDGSRRIYPWSTDESRSAIVTSVGPYARMQLWRNRVSLSASGTHEETEYLDTQANEERTDRYNAFTLMVDYKPSDVWTFGAGYSYSENDSSNDAKDSERNRFIVRLMWNY